MPVSITPLNPTASALTTYSLFLSFTIPHPNTFHIQIDLPSDTTFSISNSSCSPNCIITSTNPNNSQVVLSVTNSNPNTTSLFTETYTIGMFNNRRYVGIGSSINVTTYEIISTNIITMSSATVDVSTPNILTG